MGIASRSLTCLLVTSMVFAPGCATIIGKAADQPVEVVTEPPGATLIVDGVASSKTSPGVVELDPEGDHNVSAQLGEAKATRSVRKTIRIWAVIVDGILTGGIGVLVDYMTGALYQFEPRIQLNLGVAPPPSPPAPPPLAHGNNNNNNNGNGAQQNNQNLLTQAPCRVCGEPRGNAATCPHCGME
jgi:hypothetical protein